MALAHELTAWLLTGLVKVEMENDELSDLQLLLSCDDGEVVITLDNIMDYNTYLCYTIHRAVFPMQNDPLSKQDCWELASVILAHDYEGDGYFMEFIETVKAQIKRHTPKTITH